MYHLFRFDLCFPNFVSHLCMNLSLSFDRRDLSFSLNHELHDRCNFRSKSVTSKGVSRVRQERSSTLVYHLLARVSGALRTPVYSAKSRPRRDHTTTTHAIETEGNASRLVELRVSLYNIVGRPFYRQACEHWPLRAISRRGEAEKIRVESA